MLAARAGVLTAAVQPLRLPPLRRLPFAYGWLTARKLPGELLDSWLEPFFSDAGVRRDVRRLFAGIERNALLDNSARLREFNRPVLIAWARDDPFFPLDHAYRLARHLPRRPGRGGARRACVHQPRPAGAAGGAAARVRGVTSALWS